MKIVAVTHSSFPRVGDDPHEQKLRRAYAGMEKGKISPDEFRRAQEELIREIISIQDDAGIEIVTDGLIRWYDHASHLAKNLKGFEINGLLRFFDTNTYYRQPVISDEIANGDGSLAEEVSFTVASSKKPTKAVLLGPYSLAKLSQNNSSMTLEELCIRLGEILSQEISKMVSAGAKTIQIEEPSLIRNPQDFGVFAKGFDVIASSRGSAQLILASYFGDSGTIIDSLAETPADMIGIDFTYSPDLLERLAADGFPKSIAFGVLDGRNTRMESADEIARSLEKILSQISEDCHIATSCGLEFLPRNYAIKKLELTSRIAGILNG